MKAIEPVSEKNVVLGQYLGSDDGSQPGYKDGAFFLSASYVAWGQNFPTNGRTNFYASLLRRPGYMTS